MEMQTETATEKRKSPRYTCREDKVAYVAIRPAFKKLWKVKDVSMSGIGFSYTLLEEQEKPLAAEEKSVHVNLFGSLFGSTNGFYLPRLKCMLAYDKRNRNHSSFSPQVRSRQCGLKFDFDELTDGQKEKIALFLKHYTAGEA